MLKRGSLIVFVILVPLGFLIWRRDNDVFRSLKLRTKVENCLRAEEMCKRANLKILGSWYRSRILNVGGDVQGMLLAILSDPKEEPPLRRYAARALVTLNMRGALPVLEGLRSYGDLYSRGLASWAINKMSRRGLVS